MTKGMVAVIFYEDGEYEMIEADPHHAAQYMVEKRGGRHSKLFCCPKDGWKQYLLQYLSTDRIDDEIRKLKKQKKAKEELKAKVKKELGL